jgi:ELWxxDGT repeat protein
MKYLALLAALALTACAGNGGDYFFAGQDAEHGVEPWVTDGTTAGTRRLLDVNPGRASSSPWQFTRARGGTYFVVTSPSRQLWRTDGTEVGTVLVKDFGPRPATPPFHAADPFDLTPVDDTLFFTVDDGAHGRELWVTDGTENGTRLVVDLNPGAASSWTTPGSGGKSAIYSGVESLPGQVFFARSLVVPVTFAIDSALFRSDASAAGTRELFQYRDHLGLKRAGSRLVIAGRNDVFGSDGTANGTVLLQAFNQGREVEWLHLAAARDSVFLSVSDAMWLGNTTGSQLWRTDGTAAGTIRVKDLEDQLIWNNTLTGVGDHVFFMASPRPAGNPQSPKGLWRSDGTEAGTRRVSALPNGSVFQVMGSHRRLFFQLWYSLTPGRFEDQLWSSDGTEAGTDSLRTFRSMMSYEMSGDTLYFMAEDQSGPLDLWKSNGTTAGTVLVRAFP